MQITGVGQGRVHLEEVLVVDLHVVIEIIRLLTQLKGNIALVKVFYSSSFFI